MLGLAVSFGHCGSSIWLPVLCFPFAAGPIPPAKGLTVYFQGQNFTLSSLPALHGCEMPLVSCAKTKAL